MAPIPKPESSTVGAIYRAYEANAWSGESRTISISTLAEECGRKLWYDLHWVSDQEKIEGRKIRIFRSGDIEEERLVSDLRMIGCEVVDRDPDTGRQITVTACGGHIKGKLDSEILGLPEAPKTIHVGEIKSHNEKSFKALLKDGVRVSKPMHFGQLQTYMHLRGRSRGVYLAVCKNTDELYAERMEYDSEYCLRLISRGESIVRAENPPAKLHEDPESKMAFTCGWCKHRPVCHEGKRARVNCRTCIYSTAETGGNALWSCARFNKPLSIEEQQDGCPAHLYRPGVVDGEQIDCSEENETITYRMKSGEIWVDGL